MKSNYDMRDYAVQFITDDGYETLEFKARSYHGAGYDKANDGARARFDRELASRLSRAHLPSVLEANLVMMDDGIPTDGIADWYLPNRVDRIGISEAQLNGGRHDDFSMAVVQNAAICRLEGPGAFFPEMLNEITSALEITEEDALEKIWARADEYRYAYWSLESEGFITFTWGSGGAEDWAFLSYLAEARARRIFGLSRDRDVWIEAYRWIDVPGDRSHPCDQTEKWGPCFGSKDQGYVDMIKGEGKYGPVGDAIAGGYVAAREAVAKI